ncbi:MAG: DUF3618 domain-containing protein, partial [Burkholderiales bacterium]|nr:DUF3618 domain-containing protein [Burkholderiales bacterium]
MSHHNHQHNGSTDQSPEEIEIEIEQTRREMDYTLGQIQRKLSPGQMVDEGIAYLRNSGSGEFASNFGVTVKNNPMPVALLSVGLAWLMMASKNPPSRFSAGRFSTERYPTDYAAPESAAWNDNEPSSGPGIRERVSHAMSSFGSKASDAGSKVATAAHNVGDRVSEATSSFGSKASDAGSKVATTAHNVGDRVSHYASGARDSASHLASSASQFASGARDSATHLASSARERAMRAADAAR